MNIFKLDEVSNELKSNRMMIKDRDSDSQTGEGNE